MWLERQAADSSCWNMKGQEFNQVRGRKAIQVIKKTINQSWIEQEANEGNPEQRLCEHVAVYQSAHEQLRSELAVVDWWMTGWAHSTRNYSNLSET